MTRSTSRRIDAGKQNTSTYNGKKRGEGSFAIDTLQGDKVDVLVSIELGLG